MTYRSENLSALCYSNGFTLWHYRTTDGIDDVLGKGYFLGAWRMFRPGDFILVNAASQVNKTVVVLTNEADALVEVTAL